MSTQVLESPAEKRSETQFREFIGAGATQIIARNAAMLRVLENIEKRSVDEDRGGKTGPWARNLVTLAKLLGEDILGPLLDPKVCEIMLNPNGDLYVEELGNPGSMDKPVGVIKPSRGEAIIRSVAGLLNKVVIWADPRVEGKLPLDGSRFAGQLPPNVDGPTFSIRKRAVMVFTLDDYVRQGVMTERQVAIIRAAVKRRKNIVIVGGTGSGKTTLGNAVLNEITVFAPNARQIIIEDTGELQSTARNKIEYCTTETVSMTDLLKTTLRMRPEHIIVGEVRGGEAMDLLAAWNTGHPGGITTVHANDCAAALSRIKNLVSQNPSRPAEIEPDIAVAVDLLVNIVKHNGGRVVKEIARISGYSKETGFQMDSILHDRAAEIFADESAADEDDWFDAKGDEKAEGAA